MAKKKVAFQGERGANSEVAARKLVGDNITSVPCESFEELFDKVEGRKADLGVIPIENSLIGSIHKNYDLLLERKLVVIGELNLRIIHCLITPKGVGMSRISKVYSHPVALDQCRDFFKKHPGIAPISYYDTAGSVKMLAESGLTNSAAIAAPYAAEIYGMKLLKKSIEDEQSNYTRFLLLAKKPVKVKGAAKTSIVYSMPDGPGVLFKALSVFALRDINLTRIESRPARKRAWQYYFYIDFEGSAGEERVKFALDHLNEIANFVRILGSYPKHKE
ncbi:MAG: prephenate dehydratase [bacterium]|nr:prephenate dehydratase [bacterium]